jgi:hypothetical protein
MTALADEAPNVTALPGTGLEPSSKVTVTVPVEPGPATFETNGVDVDTVESLADTVSVPKVTPTL